MTTPAVTSTPTPEIPAPGSATPAPGHPFGPYADPTRAQTVPMASPTTPPPAATPSFAAQMGARSTEFKNALIAGGVGIAVAFMAAGFGLGYWAGDAGSSSNTPQSGFTQMGGGQMGGSGQAGSGQGATGGGFGGLPFGGGQFGGQSGSGQSGTGQTGTGTDGTTTS